jgi:CDP-glycerol glycerophosphotransferase (TagB/SpsB family)
MTSFYNLQTTIKYIIISFLKIIIEFIDYIIPKDDTLVLIGSNHGRFMAGSTEILFHYLKSKQRFFKAFYYLPFNVENNYYDNIKDMFSFVPSLFRAKYLITTHPSADFFPLISWSSKKICINYWHGVPIKAIFFQDRGDNSINLRNIQELNKKTTILVVSSILEKELMHRSFNISRTKIKVFGQPKHSFKHSTENLIKKTFQLDDSNQIVLYAPTYRRDEPVRLFPFKDIDYYDLNLFLEKNNIMLLLRGHQNDSALLNKIYSRNILNFNYDVCPNIYRVLHEIDVLITDYSSLYIDFLIFDRPTIFVPYDYERYNMKRGFSMDYNAITAGPKIKEYEGFKRALLEINQGRDSFKIKREHIRGIFYPDAKTNPMQKILDYMHHLYQNQIKT